MQPLNESAIESLLLEHLENAGYARKSAKDLNRKSDEWILEDEFKEAVRRINFRVDSQNPHALILDPITQEKLINEAFEKLKSLENEELMEANAKCHTYLTQGITLEVFYEGEMRGVLLRLVDFDNVLNNTFLACNQLHFASKMPKRFDVVLFLNGLPVVVCELKNPLSENSTLENAYHQMQTYKDQIPSMFISNILCVLGDGLNYKIGSLSADFARFMVWRNKNQSLGIPEVFDPCILLEILHFFIVFERQTINDKSGLSTTQIFKKLAAYHQYYAVQKAIQSVKNAICGDKRGGVVWHTQGSGKVLRWCFSLQRQSQLLAIPLCSSLRIEMILMSNCLKPLQSQKSFYAQILFLQRAQRI